MLTIRNNSGVAQTGAVAISRLPHEVWNVSGSINVEGNGTCPGVDCGAGEPVSWALGTLEPGEVRQLGLSYLIVRDVADGSLIAQSASVQFDGGVATASSDVLVESAPLQLGLTPLPDPVRIGDMLDYRVSYGNTTGNDVTDGRLRARIPADTTLFWASNDGQQVGDWVEWLIEALPDGGSGSRQYIVQVDGAARLITADATLESDASEKTALAQAVSSVQKTVAVNISLEVGPDPVRPLGRVTQVLTVRNNSGVAQTGAVAISRLPHEVWNVNGSIRVEGNGTCPGVDCGAGEPVSWALGTLEPGEVRQLGLSYLIVRDVADGSLIAQSASVQFDGGVATASSDVLVESAPLQLGLTPLPDPVRIGDMLDYRVSYGNTTGNDVTDGRLRARIPADTTLFWASNDGQQVGDWVEWLIEALPDGGSGSRQYIVQVDGAARLITADATLESDASEKTALAQAVSSVQETVAVNISLEVGPDPVRPLGRVTQVLTVRNNSGVAQTGAVAISRLPHEVWNVNGSIRVEGNGTCPGVDCGAG
ncbi:hypothetical protein, partial [Allochromatium palmeri]